jgi:hypothetical protein
LRFRGLLARGLRSFKGHLVLIGLPTAAIYFALGLVWAAEDGTLTSDWIPYVALYSLMTGGAMALMIWFVGRPLRERGKKRP